MSIKTNTELTLANAFIQSKFTLETMEIKLLYAIAYKLQRGDNGLNITDILKEPDDNAVYYTVKELADFLGVTKDYYHAFHRICKSLMSKNISLKDDVNEKFEILSFLIKTNYNNGILELVPNPYMKQFYMSLTKNYTRLELVQVFRMKSIYAIRIYSLIKMKAQQLKNAYMFDINEFKELLGIEKQYTRLQNFKVRVLEPAKEELNKVISELDFDYKLIKIGKTYRQLRFTFNSKALNYITIDDNMYLKARDKFMYECEAGRYCNPDESLECHFCKLKIKKLHE